MSDKDLFLAKYGHEGHLKNALKSNDQNTIEQAAKNPSLAIEDMNKLVNSTFKYRREAVSRNPNLTKNHIDKLVNDQEEDVRANIAEHPSTTNKHLDTLAKDKSHYVLSRLPHNKKLTFDQAKIVHSELKSRKSMYIGSFEKASKQKHGYKL